jgi:DNA-binding transcriptional regulator GbsR (MarR family)
MTMNDVTPRDLPPSALFALYVLEESGDPMTVQELVAETRLNDQTLRYGLNQLQECNLVTCRWDMENPRRRLYTAAMNS